MPTSTTPESEPKAEQKLTVDQMLSKPGFQDWLDTVPEAADLEMSDENRDELERYHNAFEISKTAGKKFQQIYKEKLSGDKVKGGFSKEQAIAMEQELAKEALENPEAAAGRLARLKRFEELPALIQTRERELSELAVKTAGITALEEDIATAKKRKEAIQGGLAPASVKLGVMDRLKYLWEKHNNKTDFAEVVKALRDKTDPESVKTRQKFEKFQKYEEDKVKAETDSEALRAKRQAVSEEYGIAYEPSEWELEVKILEINIQKLEEQLRPKAEARAAAENIPAMVSELKAEIATIRNEICESIPQIAEVHQAASKGILVEFIKALDSTNLGKLDEVVSKFTHFEGLREGKESTRSDYLEGLGDLDYFKERMNDQIETVLGVALIDAIEQKTNGLEFDAFEQKLKTFIERAITGFGFKTPEESRNFVVGILVEQQDMAKAAGKSKRARNLNRLINKLKS